MTWIDGGDIPLEACLDSIFLAESICQAENEPVKIQDLIFLLNSMKKFSHRLGFTLVEIMVVVVIMAILAAIVVPRILTRPEQARLVKAKQDIQTIENAMDLYKLDNGFYPSTEQGIAALVTKPTSEPVPVNWAGYLKQVPIDPWGKPYQYLNPGQHGEIDIFSFGPSTKADGNTEIGNWNIEQSPAGKSQ